MVGKRKLGALHIDEDDSSSRYITTDLKRINGFEEEKKTPQCKRPKTGGVFDVSDLPEHTYSLSDNVFCYGSLFKETPMVHVRRFNCYGSRAYPSIDGVALAAGAFLRVVKAVQRDGNGEFYLEDRTFSPKWQDSLQWIPETEFGRTLISMTVSRESIEIHKCVTPNDGPDRKTSISLTHNQWNKLRCFFEKIINSVVTIVYGAIDFSAVYTDSKSWQGTLETANVAINSSLTETLRDAFCHYIYQTKLIKPVLDTVDTENTVNLFNEAVLKIDIRHVCYEFSLRTRCKYTSEGVELSEYVNTRFLKTVNTLNVINELRFELCCL